MGRILKTFLLLIVSISFIKSQCPDLSNNTTVNGSNDLTVELCGASSVLFEVNDPLLPTGTIDWYSSTTSGFDPLSTGTPIGSSPIDSANPCDAGGCPTIEVIYIDACGAGDESLNEFMVIGSGAGFAVNDLLVTFDPNNTFGSVGNGNINVGGVCSWFNGDVTLFSGCGSLIAVGPGDYIPPNSAVIIQTSRFGTTIYDISSLCGVSECIYVLSNSCDRNVGAFSNCGGGTAGGSTRTNQIGLTCGCNDVLIYDILDPIFTDICTNIGNNGMHVFADLTYANDLCNNGPNLGSIPQFAYSAITDDFNHSFTAADCNTTQYVVGVLNSSQFNTDCCSEQITNEYAFEIACITAELQGIANLCPGECAEISVLISGGISPYNLNLSLTGLPFPFNNITLPFVGFPLDDKITICFDNGGPLVDNATFTVDAPAIAGGFSGSLVLNSISDANNCAGTINGSSISVSFNNAPDIVNPGDQEACDLGNGTGIFVLSDLTNIINNGSGNIVNYYSDPGGTMPIADPYITSGGTIYAQVIGNPCNSEIIEFQLIVITNGDAGFVAFFCTDPVDGPSTECTICDDDGILGENVSLTIIFENSILNYDFEVVWTASSGPSSTIIGSGIGTATVNFPIVETTTFAISVVTADGGCPDMTDLGDVITIIYSIQPDIDAPQNLSNCGSVELPDITGSAVPANAAYYSESGGMGTVYNPGAIITSTTTLYLYAGIEDCDVEFSFEVTIEDQAMIDDPDDVITCGAYVLPVITGINVENVSYYTEMNGAGNIVSVGTIISTSVILYLFDPICGGNQPTLDIVITPGPAINNNTDTIVCGMYIVEPITGINLSGNEMYFDTTGGNGLMINVGDTLTTDSILFIYDNTGGCEIQIPIYIEIRQPSNPGLDAAILLCEGDPTLININELLGVNLPDSTGMWLDINATGIIVDSSQVDFSSLTSGTYIFEYQILDSICVDTHSVLTINIIGSPYAGEDATLSLCNDTVGVDVLSLLGSPNSGGTFYDEFNIPAIFDPVNASFSTSTIGTSVFTYIVGNPLSSCGSDSSTFTVIVEGSVSAGADFATTLCAGNIVDLTTFLTNNSGIGVFEEPSVSGGLTVSSFNTGAVANGEYTFFHILEGSGSCPSDTATIIIFVADGANAGNDNNMIPLCGETSISLSDFIDGDLGGQFYFNNTLLPSGDITYSSQVGTFDYLYIVGDGIECPFDTAILTVVRSIRPATFLDIDIMDLCNDDCTTITFNVANNGGQSMNVFYHIESDMGEVDIREQPIGDLMPDIEVIFCVGIGSLSNNLLQPNSEYTFVLDSIAVDNPECVYENGPSVTFNTYAAVITMLTDTYCLDAQVPVGGDIYNMDKPSGTTKIPNGSQSGCDSIIEVDFTFLEFTESIYSDTLCEGESTNVNGTIYTETNTTDEFTIPNGSINGCDSLVKINITFFESTFGLYSENICFGDTAIINGEEFYAGKESDIQLFEGLNSNGCDSIVEVSIVIDTLIFSEFKGDFCPSYFTNINGILYNQTKPSGIETLYNQASNGCDSIIFIDMTFNQPTIDSTIIIGTCDDTYSFTIGTETFDITNIEGSVDVPSIDPNACDTTFNVVLVFGQLILEYHEIVGGCAVSDSGLVVIESSTGDLPLSIFYNGNTTIAFSLPTEILLPVGSGEMSIIDNDGCETILPYELFSGGGQNYEINENQGQISVSGGMIDSIVWNPIDGLSCTDCIDPVAQPSQSTTYTATVYFDDSCFVELSVDVIVIDDTPDYILPSVFSPNGDNMNDNFILTITEGAIGIPQSMHIYDRWGNLVYVGVGEGLTTDGWDGRLDGKDVAPGVYVYQLMIIEDLNIVTLYGDVTVVH